MPYTVQCPHDTSGYMLMGRGLISRRSQKMSPHRTVADATGDSRPTLLGLWLAFLGSAFYRTFSFTYSTPAGGGRPHSALALADLVLGYHFGDKIKFLVCFDRVAAYILSIFPGKCHYHVTSNAHARWDWIVDCI